MFSKLNTFRLHGDVNIARKTAETLLTGTSSVLEQCYHPEIIRLAPPLHVCEDEVCD